MFSDKSSFSTFLFSNHTNTSTDTFLQSLPLFTNHDKSLTLTLLSPPTTTKFPITPTNNTMIKPNQKLPLNTIFQPLTRFSNKLHLTYFFSPNKLKLSLMSFSKHSHQSAFNTHFPFIMFFYQTKDKPFTVNILQTDCFRSYFSSTNNTVLQQIDYEHFSLFPNQVIGSTHTFHQSLKLFTSQGKSSTNSSKIKPNIPLNTFLQTLTQISNKSSFNMFLFSKPNQLFH